MYALTLIRPWAQAIASGHKKIENRTFRPPEDLIGGWLAIHSGKQFDQRAAAIISRRTSLVWDEVSAYPMGVVAVAKVIGVLEHSKDPWFCGPFGWQLDEIRKIDPIRVTGKQGLWELPPDIEEQVMLVTGLKADLQYKPGELPSKIVSARIEDGRVTLFCDHEWIWGGSEENIHCELCGEVALCSVHATKKRLTMEGTSRAVAPSSPASVAHDVTQAPENAVSTLENPEEIVL